MELFAQERTFGARMGVTYWLWHICFSVFGVNLVSGCLGELIGRLSLTDIARTLDTGNVEWVRRHWRWWNQYWVNSTSRSTISRINVERSTGYMIVTGELSIERYTYSPRVKLLGHCNQEKNEPSMWQINPSENNNGASSCLPNLNFILGVHDEVSFVYSRHGPCTETE